MSIKSFIKELFNIIETPYTKWSEDDLVKANLEYCYWWKHLHDKGTPYNYEQCIRAQRDQYRAKVYWDAYTAIKGSDKMINKPMSREEYYKSIDQGILNYAEYVIAFYTKEIGDIPKTYEQAKSYMTDLLAANGYRVEVVTNYHKSIAEYTNINKIDHAADCVSYGIGMDGKSFCAIKKEKSYSNVLKDKIPMTAKQYDVVFKDAINSGIIYSTYVLVYYSVHTGMLPKNFKEAADYVNNLIQNNKEQGYDTKIQLLKDYGYYCTDDGMQFDVRRKCNRKEFGYTIRFNKYIIINTPIETLKEFHRQQLISIEHSYIKTLQNPITF